MDILIVITALLWFSYSDLKPMWKQKAYKEMVVSGLILSLALCLIWLQRKYMELPNPMDGIKQVYAPVDAWMKQHLK
jgi:hypothetical protein